MEINELQHHFCEKKNFSMSKFLIFEKSPIFKKSNLTFKIFFKIEKNIFLNFLFFHLVVYSLRFPKWVYLSKSFKKFRSYIFICKSSHIFSIADLGLLSYSYASMCTGVLGLSHSVGFFFTLQFYVDVEIFPFFNTIKGI